MCVTATQNLAPVIHVYTMLSMCTWPTFLADADNLAPADCRENRLNRTPFIEPCCNGMLWSKYKCLCM